MYEPSHVTQANPPGFSSPWQTDNNTESRPDYSQYQTGSMANYQLPQQRCSFSNNALITSNQQVQQPTNNFEHQSQQHFPQYCHSVSYDMRSYQMQGTYLPASQSVDQRGAPTATPIAAQLNGIPPQNIRSPRVIDYTQQTHDSVSITHQNSTDNNSYQHLLQPAASMRYAPLQMGWQMHTAAAASSSSLPFQSNEMVICREPRQNWNETPINGIPNSIHANDEITNGGLQVEGGSAALTTVRTATGIVQVPRQQFQRTCPPILISPPTAVNGSVIPTASTFDLNDKIDATLQRLKGDPQFDNPLTGTSLIESSRQLSAAQANEERHSFFNPPPRLPSTRVTENTHTTSKQINKQVYTVAEPPNSIINFQRSTAESSLMYESNHVIQANPPGFSSPWQTDNNTESRPDYSQYQTGSMANYQLPQQRCSFSKNALITSNQQVQQPTNNFEHQSQQHFPQYCHSVSYDMRSYQMQGTYLPASQSVDQRGAPTATPIAAQLNGIPPQNIQPPHVIDYPQRTHDTVSITHQFPTAKISYQHLSEPAPPSQHPPLQMGTRLHTAASSSSASLLSQPNEMVIYHEPTLTVNETPINEITNYIDEIGEIGNGGNQFSNLQSSPSTKPDFEKFFKYSLCSFAKLVESEYFVKLPRELYSSEQIKPVARCIDKGLKSCEIGLDYFIRYRNKLNLSSPTLHYTQRCYGIFLQFGPGKYAVAWLIFCQEYWNTEHRANDNRAVLTDCIYMLSDAWKLSAFKNYAQQLLYQFFDGYAAMLTKNGFETLHFEDGAVNKQLLDRIVGILTYKPLTPHEWLFKNAYENSIRGDVTKIPYFGPLKQALDRCVNGREGKDEEVVRKPLRTAFQNMEGCSIVRLNPVNKAEEIRKRNVQMNCSCAECIDPLTRTDFKRKIDFDSDNITTLSEAFKETDKLLMYILRNRPNRPITVQLGS